MPMRPALIASCSTTAESVMWPSNIAQVPGGAGSGSRQLLRRDHRGTGQRIAAVAVAYVRAGPAGSSGGRPNDVNRPGSAKATIRAMPVAVSVSTCSACARYTPRSSRR